MKSSYVPKFGPLSGVKVVIAGLAVAGPYGVSSWLISALKLSI
jgi:hypothetical protein